MDNMADMADMINITTGSVFVCSECGKQVDQVIWISRPICLICYLKLFKKEVNNECM